MCLDVPYVFVSVSVSLYMCVYMHGWVRMHVYVSVCACMRVYAL